MGSITTMRLIFALLTLGMLLEVSGQGSMFDEYWYNEIHGQGYGFRAVIPTGTMLSVFFTLAIQSAMQYIRHSLSSFLNPFQKPLTIDRSNAEDPQCNSLALVLYQPFLEADAVVPAAANALVPEGYYDRALVVANVTGERNTSPAMTPSDIPVETSHIDDSMCNWFAVVPYRPFVAVGAVEPAAPAALVSANNLFRALEIVGGGGIDLPTMIPPETAVIATTVNADVYGNHAVVVYRPIDVMTIAVRAAPGVRITLTYVSTSTSVTDGGHDAHTITIFSMETMDADQCLALVRNHPPIAVTTLTPAITKAGVPSVHGHMWHRLLLADTAPDASTGSPSPPDSKERPRVERGGNSDAVVEVSAGFDYDVDTSTPVVVETPVVLDDGTGEAKTLVAPDAEASAGFDDDVDTSTPVDEVSSSKDSSHVAPQSLESSVVPVGVRALLLAVLPTSVHSLLPEFDTLDKTVSAFLCDSWSTLRESVGPITRQDDEEHDAMRTSLPTLESCTVAAGRDFPSLTPADVRVALRGLMSWFLLSAIESTIGKTLSSSASWIWSTTLVQGVLFEAKEVYSLGRGGLVVSAMYLSFLLLLGAGWMVVGVANLMDYFGSQSDEKRPARGGRVHNPRGSRRGKRDRAKKANRVTRGLRPPGSAKGVPVEAWRTRAINARRLKARGL